MKTFINNILRKFVNLIFLLLINLSFLNVKESFGQCVAIPEISVDSVCGGVSVTFTSKSTTPSSFGIIDWYFGDGKVNLNSAPSISRQYDLVTSDTTYLVRLVITDGFDSSCSDDSIIPIKVLARPQFNFMASDTQACVANDTITFTSTISNPDDYTFLWIFGDGNSSTEPTPKHSYSSINLYDVSLTVTDKRGCNSTITKEDYIEINVNPNVSIIRVGPSQLCSPGTVEFVNNTDTVGQNIIDWQWDFGDGQTSTDKDPDPVIYENLSLKDSNYFVTLKATNINGCFSTAFSAIKIKHTPTASFNSDSPVCAESNATITYTGSADQGDTYNWDFLDGTIESGSGQGPYEVNWPTGEEREISLVVTKNGCSSQKFFVKVDVKPIPTTFIEFSDSVCLDEETTVTYAGSAGPNAIYTWDFGSSSNPKNPVGRGPHNVKWSSIGMKTISLIVVDSGCTSDIGNYNLEVFPIPSSTFNIPSPVCFNDIVTVSYGGTASNEANYLWDFDDGEIVSGSGIGPYEINWSNPGSKIVSLEVTENSCTSLLEVKNTLVNPAPTNSFYADSSVCLLDTTVVTYTGTGSGAAIYNWNFDGGNIISGSGQGPYELKWLTEGDKKITLQVLENNCSIKPDTLNVEVHKEPTSSFSAAPSICLNENNTITYTGTGTDEATYLWDFDGGAVVSGSGKGPYIINWKLDGPGIKTISLKVEENGCFSEMGTFNVNVNGIPSASFSTNRDSICSYDTLNISYNGGAGIGANYQWDFDGGSIVSGMGQGPFKVTWNNNPGMKNITLKVTENGCISSQEERGILIFELPSVSFVSSDDDSEICDGDSIVFEGLPNGLVSYEFLNNSVLQQKDSSRFYGTSKISNGDIVNLIGVDSNGCRSPISNDIKFVVNPIPVVSLTGSVINDTICEGDEVTFTASPNGFDNYQFLDGAIILQDGNDNIYVTDSLIKGNNIVVIATDKNCSSEASNKVSSEIIEPLIKPVLNCGSSGLDSIQFVWNEIDRSLGYEISLDNGFSWILPSSGSMGLQHIVNGLSPEDSIKAMVRALGNPPCGNSISSDPIWCYARACTSISLEPSNDTSICYGDSTVLAVKNIKTLGAYSLSWNSGPATKDSTFILHPDSDINFKVELVDSSQLVCPSFVHNFEIGVNPLPVVVLNSSDDNDIVCHNDSIVFTATEDFINYQFFEDAKLVQNSASNKYGVLAPDSILKVSVIVKNVYGCINGSDTIKTIVKDLPIISITSDDNNDTLCLGQTVTITADGNFSQYHFYVQDTLVQAGSSKIFITSTLSDGDLVYAKAFNNGCFGPKTNIITFKVLPSPVVVLSSNLKNDSLCLGDTITFIADPSGLVNYDFYKNGELFQSSSSNMAVIPGLKNGDFVNVIGLNSNGCPSYNINTIYPLAVEPLKAPVVNCGETTISSIEFNWDEVENVIEYQVSLDSGKTWESPSNGKKGLLHKVSGLNQGDSIGFLVKAIGNAICGDGSISDFITCKAQTCNKISFNTLNDSSVCDGNSIDVFIHDINIAEYEISWNGSDYTRDSLIAVTPVGDTTLSVSVLDSTQRFCPPVTKFIEIKFNTLPNLSLISSDIDNKICENDEVVFTATPKDLTNYKFFLEGSLVQDSGINTYHIKDLLNNESVFVKGIDKNGCEGGNSNEIKTSVLDKLNRPVVNCGNSTPQSVEFIWDKVENSIGYQVSVDNGLTWISPSSGNFGDKHNISGLSQNDSVSILVLALGDQPCGNSVVSDTVTCFARICNAITYDIIRDTTVCSGTPIELVVENPSPKNYSIRWENNKPVKDLIYQISPVSEQKIFVELIDSTQLLCPTAKKEIEIKVNPIPKITLVSSSSENKICKGDTIVFIATPNFLNYKFFYESTVLQDSSINNYSSSNLVGDGNVFVTASNKYGCLGSSNPLSTIINNPLLKPNVNCGATSEGSITFIWDQIKMASGYEVRIDSGSWESPSSGENGINHTISGLNHLDEHFIEVKALGELPCGNGPVSDKISCVAENCKEVTFDFFPADTSICEGSEVELKLRSISSKIFSIVYNNSTPSSDSTYSFVPEKDTIITVELMDSTQLGCATIKKLSQIKVNPVPEVILSSNPIADTICAGSEVSFMASPSGIGNYRFYNGGAIVQSSSSNNYKTNGLISGNSISVDVENIYGCRSDLSNYISFNIVSPLSKPIANCGNTTSNSINFVWTSINGAISYEVSLDAGLSWFAPNGQESHGINGLNPGDNASLMVRALGSTSCGGSLESNMVTCSAINCNAIKFEIPLDTFTCVNESIELIAKDINVSQYGLSWNGGTFGVDTVFNVLPTGNSIVYASLIDSSQLSCPSFNLETKIEVKQIPDIKLTLDADNICSGDSILVEVLPNNLTSYEFYVDKVIYSQENKNSKFIRFNEPGKFKISAFAESLFSCRSQETDDIEVEIKELPSIQITSDNDNVCQGDSLELKGLGGVAYNWEEITNPGATIGTGSVIKVVPFANSKFILFGTGLNGCIGTDTSDIKINMLPSISVQAIQDSICNGDSLVLIGDGGKSYNWFNISQGIGLGNGDSIIVSPVTTTIYSLTGVDSNSCSNRDTLLLTVLNSISIGASKDSICSGEEITLMAFGGSNYTWYETSEPLISVGAGATLKVKPLTTSTYVVSANGGVCKSKDSINVFASQNPDVFISGPDSVCFNQETKLYANGAIDYKWINLMDPNVVLSELDSLIIKTKVKNQILVLGKDSNLCTGMDTAMIEVKPTQNVNAGPDVTICDNVSGQLMGSKSGNGSIIWNPALGLSDSSVLEPYVTVDSTVVYMLSVSLNGCTETDSVLVSWDPCLDGDLEIPTLFTPNGDGKNDKWVIPKLTNYPNNSLQIFNRWGNLIYEMDGYDNSWDGTNLKRRTQLTDGTYFYVLILNDGKKTPPYTGYVTIMR